MGVSQEKMHTAVNTMLHIEEQSRSIVEVVKTIDDIARQTNLLALNAAIESGNNMIKETAEALADVEMQVDTVKSKQIDFS